MRADCTTVHTEHVNKTAHTHTHTLTNPYTLYMYIILKYLVFTMHGAELFFHIVSLPPHSVCVCMVCMYIVSKRFGIKFPIYCVCAPHFVSAAREGVLRRWRSTQFAQNSRAIKKCWSHWPGVWVRKTKRRCIAFSLAQTTKSFDSLRRPSAITRAAYACSAYILVNIQLVT